MPRRTLDSDLDLRPARRSAALLAAGVLLLAAVAVPAGAAGALLACSGFAPLQLRCEDSQATWTGKVDLDTEHFTGRLLLFATWVSTKGVTIQQGTVCEGPGAADDLPPEAAAAVPPRCFDFHHPAEARIPPGALVRLSCDAQSRNLGPELWVGPAGPWSCAVV